MWITKKDEQPEKRIERKTHSGPRTRHQRDQRLTRKQQLDKGTWRCSCGSRNFQSNKVCMMCKKTRPQIQGIDLVNRGGCDESGRRIPRCNRFDGEWRY